MLAWGARVSSAFRDAVIGLARNLGVEDPSWPMACMAMETGETFRADIRNAAGSGATGLIQFMPQTAALLGTTVDELAKMSPELQLTVYVAAYFRPWSGKLHSLGDFYGAILWPGMIGKADETVIFDQADEHHPKLYLQNKGLDLNHNGQITRSEIISRVQRELDRGLLPGNVYSDAAS